jgi:hypothetical protein
MDEENKNIVENLDNILNFKTTSQKIKESKFYMSDENYKNMEAINNALNGAAEYGLEVEVVYWALKAMKENPSLRIEEAIEIGFWEWVK